ncbi:MAG: sugar phosphate isomerase/epimerase [Dehalococcoidia bacterium]|nr:sugar phosphate isomerase/epimerase [Dehalococcoidia bacterium]
MSIKLGTSPDSWGVWFADDSKQIPWQRFLDEVVEAGYKWIELGPYGYLPKDLDKLRSELDQRGLKVSGTFLFAHLEEPDAWPGLEKDLMGLGELLAGLDAKFLVLIDDLHTDWFTGERIKPERLEKDAWKRLIETTHRVATIAKEKFDLRLAFHSSPDSHVAYEDQIEMLLEDTVPELVSLGQDVGHLAYRGVDPVQFVRKHQDRIPYLHIKNVDFGLQRMVQAQEIPFIRAVEMGMFCELSRGVVDYVAFREMLEEIKFDGWAIVEQDMYPAPFDKPLPIAKRNREYLHRIGFG